MSATGTPFPTGPPWWWGGDLAGRHSAPWEAGPLPVNARAWGSREGDGEGERGGFYIDNQQERETVRERVRENLSCNQQRGRSKGGRAIESEKGGEVEDAF